jgi:hypothetical protein
MEIVVQAEPAVPVRDVSHVSAVHVLSIAAPLTAWADAVCRGRLDLAAARRIRLDALADESPTWEDAEWR